MLSQPIELGAGVGPREFFEKWGMEQVDAPIWDHILDNIYGQLSHTADTFALDMRLQFGLTSNELSKKGIAEIVELGIKRIKYLQDPEIEELNKEPSEVPRLKSVEQQEAEENLANALFVDYKKITDFDSTIYNRKILQLIQDSKYSTCFTRELKEKVENLKDQIPIFTPQNLIKLMRDYLKVYAINCIKYFPNECIEERKKRILEQFDILIEAIVKLIKILNEVNQIINNKSLFNEEKGALIDSDVDTVKMLIHEGTLDGMQEQQKKTTISNENIQPSSHTPNSPNKNSSTNHSTSNIGSTSDDNNKSYADKIALGIAIGTLILGMIAIIAVLSTPAGWAIAGALGVAGAGAAIVGTAVGSATVGGILASIGVGLSLPAISASVGLLARWVHKKINNNTNNTNNTNDTNDIISKPQQQDSRTDIPVITPSKPLSFSATQSRNAFNAFFENNQNKAGSTSSESEEESYHLSFPGSAPR